MTQKGLQLSGIEGWRKVAERGGNERLVDAHLQQGCDEVGFATARVTNLGRDHRGGDRGKYEVAVDADEAFAKFDRREVALAGCAQAHDEAQGTGRDACLVRVRDDRGIEQRRRLQAVFAHEVGADQQRLQRRRYRSRRQEVSQLLIAVEEYGLDARMLMAQASYDLLQPALRLRRRQLENPLD